MLKNSFLGRRDDAATRPSVDSPLYPPKNDSPPLQAVAVTTNHVNGAPSLRTEAETRAASATSSGATMSATATVNGVQAIGPRLTVGPNIKLKGAEINDCDTLVVEGHVEASMDSQVLEILQSGSYDGTVTIDVAEIHGKFSGNLTARKKLIVHGTGQVMGTVRYGLLLVSEGGVVSGDVASLEKGDAQANLFAGYPSSRVATASSSAAKANASAVHAPELARA